MYACMQGACVPDVVAVAAAAGQARQRQPRKQAAHGVVRSAGLQGAAAGEEKTQQSTAQTHWRVEVMPIPTQTMWQRHYCMAATLLSQPAG
jgi:hypothetical protein